MEGLRISHAEDEWLTTFLCPKFGEIEGASVPHNLNEEQRQSNRVCIWAICTEELQAIIGRLPRWVGHMALLGIQASQEYL
jgi:hypothetical protein